jgi:hypothetical protein
MRRLLFSAAVIVGVVAWGLVPANGDPASDFGIQRPKRRGHAGRGSRLLASPVPALWLSRALCLLPSRVWLLCASARVRLLSTRVWLLCASARGEW